MTLFMGSSEVDALKLGSNTVDKLYRGSDLFWPIILDPESPITVVQAVSTTPYASGPQSVSITETVEPGDVAVVLYGCHRASSIRFISTITGLGAAWKLGMPQVGQISMWIGTGLTTNGTVTITQNSAAPMTAHVYILRGVPGIVTGYNTFNLGAGTLGAPSVDAALGQIVLSWMCAFDATLGDVVRFPGTQNPDDAEWVDFGVTHTGVNAFGSSSRKALGSPPGVAHSSQAQIVSGDAGYIGSLVLGGASDVVDPATYNPVVWLRAKDLGANGSNVDAWPDASSRGNGVIAVGTPPTVLTGATPNGGKACVFPGSRYFNIGYDIAWASGTYSVTYAPSNVRDGNDTTYWHSLTPGTGSWIAFRAGTTAKVVTAYSIKSYQASGPWASWDFQGSNSPNGPWTTLDSQSGQSWGTDELKNFSISNTTPYLYYRLLGGAYTNADGYVRIREITTTGTEAVTIGMPIAGDGEFWIVLKRTGGGGSWTLGSVNNGHWLFSGAVYEGAGITVRQTFTPPLSVDNWRIYRVKAEGTTWKAYLDGVQQLSVTGITKSWLPAEMLLGYSPGNAQYLIAQVAEMMLIPRALTDAEAFDLLSYYVNEHF